MTKKLITDFVKISCSNLYVINDVVLIVVRLKRPYLDFLF